MIGCHSQSPFVMVVLGTTIHEFARRKCRLCVTKPIPGPAIAPVLVDPRAKHEDDGGEAA